MIYVIMKGGEIVDCEYHGREVEQQCSIGTLQASKNELDGQGSLINDSARRKSRKMKKSNPHVNARKKFSKFFQNSY